MAAAKQTNSDVLLSEIKGAYSCAYRDSYLLVCHAMQSGKKVAYTFQNNLVPPSSE
jgi:hypothetical protein